MIIKMRQVKAINENSKKDQISQNKEKGDAEYEFIYQNVVYASFSYNENISLGNLIKTETGLVNSKKFTATFNSAKNYEIKLETIDCPPGFKAVASDFEEDLEGGRKCRFNSAEHVYYEDNRIVGRLRQYIIENPKSLLGKIPTVTLDYYDAINWKNQNYYLFPLKINGTYYECIYQGDILVSIIELTKQETTRNEYIIYAVDNLDVDFVCMMAAKFDYIYFEAYGGMLSKNKSTGPIFENGQTSFINRFDPNFINKILAAEK